ncbi:bifunctional hydroxymethylpyrimidine kinase/phosphomethylpyrimidine kinase [Roseomonas sp. KE2513]|uniref:bifunctional hydroxymethylpyrimidine kinase/phosphomethylpyrimidine kinase n=1 Tax=Roseomonas sp. KE2513 TaxID=2479202 RepID=UPI0018DF1279|nr:bifunctional hydroxymethylpyrimidine kinase/phosphomethylpyrimidine kinase [Roseomonas sp. KE2513]MBI0534043.1 bifunctional hydroxymethylpyrimidine kinase/phosphomethylpyrimidine kinase [Roseomonas sp. KE2513]
MKGRVLIVAGSDSGGGAGIQADIKAVTAMGAYAATAVTALTAQDTEGVRAVHPVPLDFLQLQIRMSLEDIGADCIKTGMLADAPTIDAVCDALAGAGLPLVADPVMVAKGGARLLDPAAVETLKRRLMPLATVLTPNLPEAEVLSGMEIRDVGTMHHAAEVLMTLGVPAVLLKGGHLEGPVVTDVLATEEGVEVFESPRIETRHTHGTGCTLASAIAAGLAQGMGLRDAVLRARGYVAAAIRSAPGYGRGHGPLDHGVTVDPARVAAV